MGSILNYTHKHSKPVHVHVDDTLFASLKLNCTIHKLQTVINTDDVMCMQALMLPIITDQLIEAVPPCDDGNMKATHHREVHCMAGNFWRC